MPKDIAVKMPVKLVNVVSKKTVQKKKNAKKSLVKKASSGARVAKKDVAVTPDVIVVPPKETVTPVADVVETASAPKPEKEQVRPAASAVVIAGAAKAEDAPTIESFCVMRGARPSRVPDGYVLMPGRTDLMSCSDK